MQAEVLESLKSAVTDYDTEGAAKWARKAVEQGVDPIEALDALTEAMRQVGDGYERGELFLPDLVGAAEATQVAMPVLQEEIENTGVERKPLATVVIGTVFGDIHNIGKSMICGLLRAEGFEVHDLGIDVNSDVFMEAIREHDPDILAMSALTTMTAPQQGVVIDTLKEEGIRDRVKVMVGGGAITPEFAETIGADGYAASGPKAVALARKLVGAE